MRVAVMGSGGIGGIVGGRLASSGADVIFIARGAHLRAMQSSGLKVLSQLGDVTLPRVQAMDNPSGQAPVDFVIFAVKGPDTIDWRVTFVRVLAFDPVGRPPGTIGRAFALGNDALHAKQAGVPEDNRAFGLDVIGEVDAVFDVAQQLGQRRASILKP